MIVVSSWILFLFCKLFTTEASHSDGHLSQAVVAGGKDVEVLGLLRAKVLN